MPNVLRVHNPNATAWNFTSGNYWSNINKPIVKTMLEEGLKLFTGQSTLQAAWNQIFLQNGGNGYVAGQKVAIKINWNDCGSGLGDGENGNYLVSNTQTMEVLVESLLANVSGLTARNILVGDPFTYPFMPYTPSGGRRRIWWHLWEMR